MKRSHHLAVWLFSSCLACVPVRAQDCEVKVGVLGPMTGAASTWGLATKAGVDVQAAIVNSEGGLPVGNRKCKVRVVAVDGQCSVAGGAAGSNSLAAENVAALVGPVCSTETAGFRPVAKRHGQLGFSSSYMKDVMGPEWPLMFHMVQGPAVFAPILVKAAVEKFKIKSVVVLGPNDQSGTDAGRQTARVYSDNGVKATEEYYQRGTPNLAPIATRIMITNPDAIEFSGTPTADVTVMVKALLEAGYKGIFGGLAGIGIGPVLSGAGGDVSKLKGYYWLELMPVDDPGARKLRVDYERMLKAPPPEVPNFYVASTAAEQVLRAISIAGTDRDVEKIAAALRKTKPESRYFGKGGWRGKAQYGINQELAFPIGMGVIADGKNQGVERIDIPAE